MANTDYPIRDNVDQHRFEADLGDGSIAIAEYNLLQKKIVFTTPRCRRPMKAKGLARR